MVRLEETIVVARPLADCFRYLADFSTIEQWDPGVYRARKATPGAAAVGSTFELILDSAGVRSPITYTLKEYVAGARLVLEGVADNVHALDTLEFKAIDANRTEIRYVAELTLQGAAGKAEFVFKPWLDRVGKRAVAGLQRALDPEKAAPEAGFVDRLKERLVLPGAWEFTEKGYLGLANKGLSTFMDGQVVVVTGPTSGLGLAAACELSRLGARLVLVGRDRVRLDKAADEVVAFSGAARESVEVFEAELSLVSELERVGALLRAAFPRIDALVHNAGALFAERAETAEGHERTLAVHVLAPWVLTRAVLPSLQLAGGRVILVASGGLYTQALDVDDLESRKGTFDGSRVYARAKRAMVTVGEDWAKRWSVSGVDVYAMHPGWAATPGVTKSLPTFDRTMNRFLRDARMGADTIVWLASSPVVEGRSGRFWFDRKPRPTELLPRTRVSETDRARLLAWLEQAAPERKA